MTQWLPFMHRCLCWGDRRNTCGMGSWHQALAAVPVLRAIQARIFPMKEVPVVGGKAGDLESFRRIFSTVLGARLFLARREVQLWLLPASFASAPTSKPLPTGCLLLSIQRRTVHVFSLLCVLTPSLPHFLFHPPMLYLLTKAKLPFFFLLAAGLPRGPG